MHNDFSGIRHRPFTSFKHFNRIDLTIGAFVGLGIQFGVAAEAIELAAILSFPKTPWAMTNPLYHDAPTFNEITSRTFISRCFFDAGLLSEPLAIANLLHAYTQCKDKNKFTKDHRISGTRIRHLLGTVENLKQRCANYLNARPDILEVRDPPCRLHPSKLNILRIIQVWVFHDSIIVHDASKSKVGRTPGPLSIDLDGAPIERGHLRQVLNDRHNFEIISLRSICQSIRFDSQVMEDSNCWLRKFDTNLASYMLEKNISFAHYTFQGIFKIIVPLNTWDANVCKGMRDAILGEVFKVEERTFRQHSGNGNQRGRRGRACGMWQPDSGVSTETWKSDGQQAVVFISCQLKSNINSIVDKELRVGNPSSILYFYIAKTKKKVIVSAVMSGKSEKISDVDLKDMFMASDLNTNVTTSTSRQSVLFFPTDDETKDDESQTGSLLNDAPEGARLMTVLASGRRKDHFIRFSNGVDSLEFIDVNIPRKLSIQGGKWKRHYSKAMVFVPENSPPMATIPVLDENEIFGCCASTLDLKGGTRRVEGITLMPPGRLFTGLALLSFGFHPRTLLPVDETNDEFNYHDILSWIFEKEAIPHLELEMEGRVAAALDFNASCMNLGEVLECQPDKIRSLCALFDGVAGSMEMWDGYETTLSAANVSLRSKPKLVRKKESDVDAARARDEPLASNPKHVDTALSQKKNDKFTCEGCSKSFSQLWEARKHANQCPFINFACDKCGDLFTKWNFCMKHRAICCPNEPETREKAITVVSPPSKEENSDTRMLQRWACQHCSDSFAKKKEYVRHMKKCSGGRRYFDTSKACQLHIKSCASTCLGKEKKTELKSVSASSANSEPVERLDQWVCRHCNQAFAKKKLCMRHIRTNQCSHNDSEQNMIPMLMYACPSCSKLFAAAKACRLHIRTCNNSNQDSTSSNAVSPPHKTPLGQIFQKWACEGCGETFVKRRKCINHSKSCQLCGKKITPKLVFPCPGCNAKFSTSAECKAHSCQILTCKETVLHQKEHTQTSPDALTVSTELPVT